MVMLIESTQVRSPLGITQVTNHTGGSCSSSSTVVILITVTVTVKLMHCHHFYHWNCLPLPAGCLASLGEHPLLEFSLKNLSVDRQSVLMNLLMKHIVPFKSLLTPWISLVACVCVFNLDHFIAWNILTSLQSIYKLFPCSLIVFQKQQNQALPDQQKINSPSGNMSVVCFCICMFDKVVDYKEVLFKCSFMLFGNHFVNQLFT